MSSMMITLQIYMLLFIKKNYSNENLKFIFRIFINQNNIKQQKK